MISSKKNIVLVHGLWNNPVVFNRLIYKIKEFDVQIFLPDLPHNYGRTNLFSLAQDLEQYISTNIEDNVPLDILGFSMGGLIARIWLQKLGGATRTKRFISVGTPHRGTFLAELIPSFFLNGVAQMKRSSPLLLDLNSDISSLRNIECISTFCRWDLMVFPGWQAVLPFGLIYSIPVLYHKQLISSDIAIDYLVPLIIND